jgi:type II protein arginine methyltransferase
MTGSAASLESLLSHVADKPVPLARLARLLLAKGQDNQARQLCARAVAMAPGDPEVRTLAAEILSHGVPHWHWPMMQDGPRNLAYAAALHRAIRPGYRVLEIGTGSGLIAMMAARAGAAQVVTCERNAAIAEVASEIIACNGFTERVRVVAKHSADLAIGVDLEKPANVLVSELVSINMISGGVLPAIEQAVRRLVRPDALIIPACGIVRVALAEDRDLHHQRIGIVDGFDLSRFNQLAVPYYPISVGNERLVLRSEPGDLFRFNFQSGGPFPEATAALSLSALGGTVNGIAQWIRLEMDKNDCYENQPTVCTSSHWAALFYPLRSPIDMAAGDTLTVYGAHDRLSLRIWAEDTGAP